MMLGMFTNHAGDMWIQARTVQCMEQDGSFDEENDDQPWYPVLA